MKEKRENALLEPETPPTSQLFEEVCGSGAFQLRLLYIISV